ncbi:MAG: DUF4870 domain-containing protein [Planctomycetota bacterium]
MSNASQIAPEERAMAALAHLSGLAGYLVPLGGIVAPIVLMCMQRETPIVPTIARQALYLNIAVLAACIINGLLFLTVVYIPIGILVFIVLGVVGVLLPILGAVKAANGEYYRYPVIGSELPMTSSLT